MSQKFPKHGVNIFDKLTFTDADMSREVWGKLILGYKFNYIKTPSIDLYEIVPTSVFDS